MFRGRIFSQVVFVCLIVLGLSITACSGPSRNIEAVLWIGGFAHDFEAGAAIIIDDILSKVTPSEVEIVRDGSFLDSPKAEKLDVIVMHHCFKSAEGVINKRQKQKLLDLIRGGVGVVAIHASYYTFPEWHGVRELYGAKFIKHGAIDLMINVRTVDKSHPIMEDLDESFVVKSELYESTPLAKDCHLLAMASEKGKAIEHPSVWTRMYGKGRVVTILPAHWPESFRVESFQKLIANGVLWAAGRLDGNKK
ncbi:MAG: ThuA domain-containing protein [Planctomycetota bacterium]|nr:MAG: ThuA domain-containing protein [Planctomycetota bacterium]